LFFFFRTNLLSFLFNLLNYFSTSAEASPAGFLGDIASIIPPLRALTAHDVNLVFFF